MILRKQFLAHVAQTSPSPMLVEVARAEGSFFYTPEGKRYFDLVAGVSVSNVGHGNPAVAGYRIVATTPHREDATPETFDVGRGPFALVFGTEHAGISDEVIASADEFLRIPMCGMVESLNVSASAAILIYTLSERMRLTVGNWRMSDAEQAETLCRWMRRSVKDSEAILQRRGMVPDL
ncbi:aminotransferase class III-fold pyridoxal phosphate-dependent enzyme [Alistipes shahii]|uniref:aminotransferase class III-fold pyridoxal phosphate-dependent enzyme n=1 Tax=Alistipes shahii TaxID=328814 RepID=UPI0040275BCF